MSAVTRLRFLNEFLSSSSKCCSQSFDAVKILLNKNGDDLSQSQGISLKEGISLKDGIENKLYGGSEEEHAVGMTANDRTPVTGWVATTEGTTSLIKTTASTSAAAAATTLRQED